MTLLKMIKVVFAALLIFNSYSGCSQTTTDASVEKSTFGIQIGPIGVWGHNELKLSNQVALRSEIGYAGVNTGNIEPLIALEPRWYYNLNNRANKNKRIDGNSGNYFSLRTAYRFFDINDSDKDREDYLSITANWGIRRNIGKHFNYEAGIGIGLGVISDNGTSIGYTTHFNLKIGYRF